jgi:hypothetical protein
MQPQIVLAILALLILVLCTACQEADGEMLSLPQGSAIAVDGTIQPEEWATAHKETFADGSELLLTGDQGTLYLAIRSNTPDMIVGNVYLNQGDEIRILHTSAALGTAVYRREGEGWQQAQNFHWRCRRADDGDAARAERDAFFQDEGWVSVNSRVGAPNELEYRIEVPSGPLRLAVNHIKASDTDVKHPWPPDLDDDTVRPTPGGLPAQMRFTPERWASIDVP